MIRKDELTIKDWVNVPELISQSNDGNYQISQIFDDGITVEGYDEKISYADICPVEFGGKDLVLANGFGEAWDFGMLWNDITGSHISYDYVKEIIPGDSYCKICTGIDDYGKEHYVYYHGVNIPGQMYRFKNPYFHELQNAFRKLGLCSIADNLKIHKKPIKHENPVLI